MSRLSSDAGNPRCGMGENLMINMAKPVMEAEEKQAVLEVLESGILAQGPRVAAF